MDRVHFSSEKTDWATPRDFYARLDAEFSFGLDAAATANNAKHANFISPVQDALKQDWAALSGGKPVFLNPPYGDAEEPCRAKCKKKRCPKRGYHVDRYVPGIADFVAKAAEEGTRVVVVALLPARTDTGWFHSFIWDDVEEATREGVEVRFEPGRLKFEGASNGAPFPSMVVVWRPKCPFP